MAPLPIIDKVKTMETKLQIPMGEYITHELGDEDAWVCICRNTPADSGFYPCDEKCNEMEPSIGSNWDGLYVCADCGRIIKQDTLEVVGINPSPKFLD
jgi:hypothetical protein